MDVLLQKQKMLFIQLMSKDFKKTTELSIDPNVNIQSDPDNFFHLILRISDSLPFLKLEKL